jgi:Ca-activated chloride channel family protein
MRFAAPGLLFLLPVAILVLWLARRDPRRREPALPAPSLALLPPARGVRPILVRFASWARLLGILLVVIAAARPQAGNEVREVVSQGIDILLAIDASGSMRSEDFRPRNRLFVAKQVAKEFIGGRREDRIGLIAFAGRSELVAPLTLDYGGLAALIDGLDFGQLDDGTAIGSAIAQAAERLRHASGKSRVVILLTDGINNAGAVDPVTAARLAHAVGVRVYTIGAGTEGVAPYPIDDPVLGRRYIWVRSDVDEPTLRDVARLTGGRYFRATTPQLLAGVYREIGALEPSRVEMRSYTRWAEIGPALLMAGLSLLALVLLLESTALVRYP